MGQMYTASRNKKGATISRDSLFDMVRPDGLEPSAHGLKVRYSTN